MTFANEMRDFIGGWSAVMEMGQKKKGMDLQKQSIEDLKSYREAALALDTRKLDMQGEQFNQRMAQSAQQRAVAAGAKGSKAEAKAFETVFEGLESADDYDVSEGAAGGYEEEAVPEYAHGGLVRKMAAGGMIEEDPDMPFLDPNNPYVDPKKNAELQAPAAAAAPAPMPAAAPAPAEAIPTGTAKSGGLRPPAEEPAATPEQQPKPEAVAAIVGGAQEATSIAAPALVADAKQAPAAVGPGSEEDKMDIIQNKGGLSTEEWKALVQTIDPNNSIPDYLQTAAVLSSTYKYFMENGQPEKAARISKGILILNKQMTQTLGALAVNAIEEGNLPAAAQLVSDAANRFPTGHQISVEAGENGLTYSVMNEGKVVETGELNTEQFWQLAGKVKDGSLYLEEMGRFAQTYSKGGGSPEQALNTVSEAYVGTMRAKRAFEDAELAGTSGEELEQLRSAALASETAYKKSRAAALKAGVKQSDITAANKDADETAIPVGPEAGAAAAASGEKSSINLAPGAIPYNLATGIYNMVRPREAAPDATPPGSEAEPAGLKPLGPDDLSRAKAAIAAGAPVDSVVQYLREQGFSAEGL
jgi:hypothetical protein